MAWTGHPASQRLGFLAYKMGTTGPVKNKQGCVRKALGTVPGLWKVLEKSAFKLLLFDG